MKNGKKHTYFSDVEFLVVNRVKTNASYAFDPSKPDFDFYHLTFMEGASVEKVTAVGSVKMHTPFFFWGVPGDKQHVWRTIPGEGLRTNSWIILQGERPRRIANYLDSLFPERSFTLASPHGIAGIMKRMYALFKESPIRNHVALVCMLEELVGALHTASLKSETLDIKTQAVIKCAGRISEYPGSEFDLEEFAKRCALSGDTFRRIFRRRFGCPPHEYRMCQRFALACRLLADPSVREKEIAESCGFGTLSEFFHFFKKRSGETPGAYRKKIPCIES